MCRSYHDREPGDIFGTIMLVIIIAIILAVIFAYIGAIVGIIVLSIGAGIGLIYALIIYIRSFINAKRTLTPVSTGNTYKDALTKWLLLFKNASHDAFLDNMGLAKAAFQQSHNYRFFHPKKWLNLAIAVSTFIVAPLLIVALIVIQIALVLIACIASISLLISFCGIIFVACLIYGLIMLIKSSTLPSDIWGVLSSFNFNSSSHLRLTLSDSLNYFNRLIKCCSDTFANAITLAKSNASSTSGLRLISVKRYFLLISCVAIPFVSIILDIIIFVFLTVVFVPLFIVNAIFSLIVMIINKIKHI